MSKAPAHSLRSGIVTLLSDFGTRDPYVGAMSGAILSVNPAARLVTITHDLPPHDLHAASHGLASAAPYFPPGTVHLAVVDPGVGSGRRALVIRAGEQIYVGPDNGLFSGVLDLAGASRAFAIDSSSLGLTEIHPTFHGRDLFAPVAARLSLGMEPRAAGFEIFDPVRLQPTTPVLTPAQAIEARVLAVDRFGNVETNVTRSWLRRTLGAKAETALRLAGMDEFIPFHDCYEEGRDDRIFFLWSSTQRLEFAAYRTRADSMLRLSPGDTVLLTTGPA